MRKEAWDETLWWLTRKYGKEGGEDADEKDEKKERNLMNWRQAKKKAEGLAAKGGDVIGCRRSGAGGVRRTRFWRLAEFPNKGKALRLR